MDKNKNNNQAGKGDIPRDVDKELYDAGYQMVFGKTKKEKLEAAKKWKRLKRRRINTN